MQRQGWGTFDVEAKIIFQPKYGRKPCWTTHNLDFNNHAYITKVDLDQEKRVSTDRNLILATRETYNYKKAKDFPKHDQCKQNYPKLFS